MIFQCGFCLSCSSRTLLNSTCLIPSISMTVSNSACNTTYDVGCSSRDSDSLKVSTIESNFIKVVCNDTYRIFVLRPSFYSSICIYKHHSCFLVVFFFPPGGLHRGLGRSREWGQWLPVFVLGMCSFWKKKYLIHRDYEKQRCNVSGNL